MQPVMMYKTIDEKLFETKDEAVAREKTLQVKIGITEWVLTHYGTNHEVADAIMRRRDELRDILNNEVEYD